MKIIQIVCLFRYQIDWFMIKKGFRNLLGTLLFFSFQSSSGNSLWSQWLQAIKRKRYNTKLVQIVSVYYFTFSFVFFIITPEKSIRNLQFQQTMWKSNTFGFSGTGKRNRRSKISNERQTQCTIATYLYPPANAFLWDNTLHLNISSSTSSGSDMINTSTLWSGENWWNSILGKKGWHRKSPYASPLWGWNKISYTVARIYIRL